MATTTAIAFTGAMVMNGLHAETATLRATKPLSPDATAAIAKFGAPRTLSRQAYPDAKHLSAKQVISFLCGSFDESYWSETRKQNPGLNTSEKTVLEDRVYTIQWPACAYVLKGDTPLEFRVRDGDTAPELYRRFTGTAGSASELKNFFHAKQGARGSPSLENLQAGTILGASHATLPTPVEIRDSVHFEAALKDPQFSQYVQEIPSAPRAPPPPAPPPPPPPSSEYPPPPPPPVSIAAALPSDSGYHLPIYIRQIAAAGVVSGQYQPPQECLHPSSSAAMLDPVRIGNVYQMATKQIGHAQLQTANVDVIVADNGFLGAAMTPAGTLDFGAGFPSRFFYNYQSNHWDGIIGPIVNAGALQISPVMDITQVGTPDAVSGHGTHITGLVIGGAAFQSHLEIFDRAPNDSWLRVSIMNIGNGHADLVDGSELDIAQHLESLWNEIVNLSLEYTDDGDPRLNSIIKSAVTRGDELKDLFVVAAGNNANENLQKVPYWPAALGGTISKNVVTVAAHRQDGALTAFTNRGPLAVDLAAPGCELSSWLDGSATPTPVSGTSQAAAVTTFAAALLKSLGNPSNHWIKRRLMISGELLEDTVPPTISADQGSTVSAGDIVSRSRLSVPNALHFEEDLLRYQLPGDLQPTEAVGQVVRIDDLTCTTGTNKWSDLWAIKRGLTESRTWLFAGRKSNVVEAPCELQGPVAATLWFKARVHLNADGTESTDQVDRSQQPIPVSAIQMYVAQTPPSQND